jgi:polyhydroxyalkanoate synthesis regulator phasin
MVTTLEPLKKAFLIGLGATVLTAERVKELMDDLVARGELSQNEAKQFGDDLRERAIKEKELFEGRVKEVVDGYLKKAVDSLGLVTKADLDTLRAELQGHQHA